MNETLTVASAKPWATGSERPFVRIEKVTKKFGDFYAVDDVSLDIWKGELFCLLGGSGCGKSTLLRMLAGFETPTSGRIEIDGQDMTGHPALRAADQHDVPVLRALPAHDGGEERRLRAAPRRHEAARRCATGSPTSCGWCKLERARRGASRTSSRAASGSGWRWRGAWSSGRSSCCSTSRSARSTRSCARRPSSSWSRSRRRSASPSSSSPTTRRRR